MPRAPITIATALALALTGCDVGGLFGDDDPAPAPTTAQPSATPSPSPSPTPTVPAEPAKLACLATDLDGVDDAGINQVAFAGLQRARTEHGVEIAVLEPDTAADLAPILDAYLDQGCDLVVAVGPVAAALLADRAAEAPTTQFALLGARVLDPETGEPTELPNVVEVTFDRRAVAFLAGYVAAARSQTGVVGTFGSHDAPTVTEVMDGFAAGVAHHNAARETAVSVVGWDRATQDGLLLDPPAPPPDAEDDDVPPPIDPADAARSLLDQDADVLLPVAGARNRGVLEVLEPEGAARAIWTVADGCAVTDACPLLVTSVILDVEDLVAELVQRLLDGDLIASTVMGSLANGDARLAPFPREDELLPPDLAAQVEQLAAAIIAGEVSTG